MNKSTNIYAPVKRPGVSRSRKDESTGKQPLLSMEFFICFISFSMLLGSNIGGSKAIVGFLAPWIWVMFRRFYFVWRGFTKYWPLFLLPALVIASTGWSDVPQITFRGGLEYFATVAIGVMAGHSLKPRVLTSALLGAFIVTAILCIAAGRHEIVSTTGESAYTGIFGSKNAFAAMMSLLLLVSVSVYLDKSQRSFFRIAALGGLLLTPVLIYLGRSLGSTLAACFSIAVFLSVQLLARYKPKTRLIVCVAIFMVATSVILVASFADFGAGNVLNSMGKDTSLTGRTYLWRRGLDFASENPLLGVGAGSFWRVDNPRALELWDRSHVTIGAGLGFHSEYINMLVELGAVGLVVMLGYFIALTRRVIKGVLGTMSAEQNFAFILFVFFMIRTPVETGLFGQFNIETILFCIIWIYFQPPSAPAKYRNLLHRGN